MTSASRGGSKSFDSCAIGTGSPATSNAASRMPLVRVRSSVMGSGGLICAHLGSCSGVRFQTERGIALALHVDRRVRRRLRDVEQMFPRQLENRQKRHHQARHVDLVLEEREKLDKS